MGCSNTSTTSAIARLEEDSPVVHGKLEVLGCKFGDQTLDCSSLMTSARGGVIELTGTLAPGEWSTRGIMSIWEDENGPALPQSIALPAKMLQIILLVHGDDTSKDLGVLHFCPVHTREKGNEKGEFEFRVKFGAPQQPGRYVVDIHAFDMNEPHLQRGETASTPPGSPIWRRELLVE